MAAGILGIGVCLPDGLLTNDDLAVRFGVTPEWIFERTGIHQRRIADLNQACSDLAIAAARQAMERSGTLPDEIGMVIVATLTGDYPTPATAAIVQGALGIPAAACFDLAAACTGFVYGLTVSCQAVETGYCRKILLIGAEVLSRVTDPQDRDCAILFGDGAGAAVIGQVPDGYGLLVNEAGTIGSEYKAMHIPAGGSRLPTTAATVAGLQHFTRMDGMVIFMFAMRLLGNASLQVIEKAGLTLDDISLIIPHQANRRIIEAAAQRLDIPLDKVLIALEACGNTSAASIPLALDTALRDGRIRHGDRLVLTAFGGGISWGASVLRWYGSSEKDA